MYVAQHLFTTEAGWQTPLPVVPDNTIALVLAFGPTQAPAPTWFAELRSTWPQARVVYVSGGGQIAGARIEDDVTVVNAVRFRTTRVHAVALDGVGDRPCDDLGAELGRALATVNELRHVLVFCDGLALNGTAFARGLGQALPTHVGVSGGLASDGTEFKTTCIGLDGPPVERRVVAIGLAGADLIVGAGSAGGWDDFGPDRRVTHADGAIVHALDDEPALDVYRRYLGPLAEELPGSALLFPLALRATGTDAPIVRTILGVDDAAGSLRFAGEVPEGGLVRLMRADVDRLLDGAGDATQQAQEHAGEGDATFALCVSCIGRRAVMRSRTDEELEEVQSLIGNAIIAGFYSNGEIGPHETPDGIDTVLHNQTMTVTLLGER
jgi:hypothetical protein